MNRVTAIQKISHTVATMVLVGAAQITFTSARAATWIHLVDGIASGDWGIAANWNPNMVPNATDAIADFSTLDLTADSTITVGSPAIVGTMIFGDSTPSHNWIISGSAITKATSTSMPTITVDNQQVTFNNSVNGSLKKLGSGTLTLAADGNALYNGFAVNGGTMQITGTVTSSGGRVHIGSANLADAYGTTGANGTLVIEPGANLTISAFATDTFVIGRDNGGVGTVTQNGGVFNFSAPGKDYLVSAGWSVGTNNLNGGILNLYANRLGVGNHGGTGVFNLNGGTLVTRAVTRISGGTGTFNLNGGTLQPTASRNDFFQGLNVANVKTGGAKIDSNGFEIRIAQNLLADGGGLMKSGTGTLTLSGINTYTGETAVMAGRLVGATGGSCANSAVTVESGATLGVQLLTSGGYWVCSSLTHSAGDTALDFDFGAAAPSTHTAPLQVNGDLTLSGTPNIIIWWPEGITNGVYPLVKYTGMLSGTPPTTVSMLPFTFGAFISNNVANASIDLVVTNASIDNTYAYTWDGTVNNWSSPHWLPGFMNGPITGSPKVLIARGTVTFQDRDMFGNWDTLVSPAVTLNGGILKSADTFNTLWNLRMGGGTLLADGGVNGNAQAFQLAGSLTVTNTSGNTTPSLITLLSSGNNGLNTINLGGRGDTAFTMNINDVTGDAAADLVINTVLQRSGPAGAIPLVKEGAGTLALTAANTYDGGTRINAGTVAISNNTALGTGNVTIASNCTVTALTSLSVANAFVLSNDATTLMDVGAGLTLTLSGTLSGAGGLSKVNAGTLTLSNINTYSGDTTIHAGTLVSVTGASCANSAVTLAAIPGNGATLGVSVRDNNQQWICPSLTVNNTGTGCTLDFNFNRVQPSVNVAPLRVIGTATFTTTPTVTVDLSGSAFAVGAQYPLMTWGSMSGMPPTDLIVTALHAVTAHLTVSGNTLYLVIDSATEPPMRWATSPSGIWDTATANWKDNAGISATYAETNGIGDHVVFDDTYVTADTTVTLNRTVNPTSVMVNNTDYNYTLSGSGAIAGSPSLTKRGAGTLTLAAASTYNSFQINGGSVVVSSNLTINGTGGPCYFFLGNANTAYSGTLTINTGATITVTGALNDNVVIGRDGGNGTVIQNGGLFRIMGYRLHIGASYDHNTRASYTLNGGVLDIANNFVIVGFGSGQITSVFNQTGGHLINVHTLWLGENNSHGIYTLSGGTTTLGEGGIKSWSGLYTINLGGGTIGSSANWASSLNMNLTNLNGSVTFDVPAHMANTLSGVLSGEGGLSKTGEGVLILSGANTYAGTTVVSNGSLVLNGSITNCTVVVDAGATFSGTGTLKWQAGQTVTVSGTMDISQLNLALGTVGRMPYGNWTVVDYQNGTLTGSAFAGVSGLPPHAKIVYDTETQKIILRIWPEGSLIRFF
jgi:fibronectin-binding autotransporter adhesin